MSSRTRVLVTGADGFIGSHLTESLVRQGFNVRAFIYYNSLNSWGWLDRCEPDVKGQFEPYLGDIRDPFSVREAMEGIDVVYHLAALIAIPYSYRAVASYTDTNISGTVNVLEAARRNDIQRVVHTSTSEVYGTAQVVPITEEHPLQAQSPYAASKIGADQLALSYFRSFETPVTVVRPFNCYGPRQSARAVIPTIISQIASGKTDIRLGHLAPTRDFNYVADTVSGFMSVGNADATLGEVVNVGSGFEISIGDLAKLIGEVMEADITVEQDDDRFRPAKSEVFRLCASNSKALELAGWQPEYGGIEGLKRGLAQTAEWFLAEENLASYKASIYNV